MRKERERSIKDIREEQERNNKRRLLEAKIGDQYQFAISKNKVTHTDFLNMLERVEGEKFLQAQKIKNYLFFGGNGEESERNILIFYPEKFSQDMVRKNFAQIVSGIQIKLPKNLTYEHKIYLSGVMKLGIKREKIGDILVRENGADIIVLAEVAEFLRSHMQDLTRFKSAEIEIVDIEKIEPLEKKFEVQNRIVSSMRLDNFVAELSNCSRSKAVEIINQQRVFLNDELVTKFSKKINVGDRITIRGRGKFIVEEFISRTKSNKFMVSIKKYK